MSIDDEELDDHSDDSEVQELENELIRVGNLDGTPADEDPLMSQTEGERERIQSVISEQSETESAPGEDAEPAAESVDDESSDDVPDLEEGANPQPSDWKRLREVTKSERQQKKKLEEQIKEMREQLKTQSQPQTQQASEQNLAPSQAVTPEQAFDAMVRATYEEYETPEKNAQIKQAAQTYIEQGLEPRQILEVMRKAQSNGFAENSEEVERIAKDALTVATARALEAQQQQSIQTQQTDDYTSKYASSVSRVQESEPDLADENSDMFKHVSNFIKRQIGTPENPGPFQSLVSDPSWPETLLPLAKADFVASKLSPELVLAENKKLKSQLAAMKSPSAGGRGPSDAAPAGADPDVAALSKELVALGEIPGWS